MKSLALLLAALLPSAALAQTTATTIGPTTYISRPGAPTATATTIGGSTYISRPGEKTVRCTKIGNRTYCN